LIMIKNGRFIILQDLSKRMNHNEPILVFLRQLEQSDSDIIMFFFGEIDEFDKANKYTMWWAVSKTRLHIVQTAFTILSPTCEIEIKDYGDCDNFLFRVRWETINPIVFNKELFPTPY
jgi:hypothetical protein